MAHANSPELPRYTEDDYRMLLAAHAKRLEMSICPVMTFIASASLDQARMRVATAHLPMLAMRDMYGVRAGWRPWALDEKWVLSNEVLYAVPWSSVQNFVPYEAVVSVIEQRKTMVRGHRVVLTDAEIAETFLAYQERRHADYMFLVRLALLYLKSRSVAKDLRVTGNLTCPIDSPMAVTLNPAARNSPVQLIDLS